MTNQQRKNRFIILLLFGMSIVPFLIAYGLKENPELLTKRMNNGELIIPPVVTEREEFVGYDEFSSEHRNELQGRWLIVNLVPTRQCNTICQEAIHKSRQLQLMMNKDLTRTRRVVLVFDAVEPDAANRPWLDEKVLLKMKPGESLLKKFADIYAGKVPDGSLVLMDPLGNLIMRYEPGFDPYKVKSDLGHLLKISQIG